jgi:hypothetical protein
VKLSSLPVIAADDPAAVGARGLQDLRRDGRGAVDPSDDPAASYLSSPGPDAACWRVPWLTDLLDVPADATWPRLMTLPHPRAVGSYGTEVERQFRERLGREPRWWQRLFWRRALEHDADGSLVWLQYLLSLSRQVGKSWALREKMLWRLRQLDRWGDQLVVHTGKDLGIVQEVMQPAMVWAERQRTGGWLVEWTNGRWSVSRRAEHDPVPCPNAADLAGHLPVTVRHPDQQSCRTCLGDGVVPSPLPPRQARWLGRAHRGVYGFSATNAEVDEGWKVPTRAVDDGLFPTLVEQVSPQLGLTSTAHPECTALMLDNRVAALQQLTDPVDRLLLEWSSPRTLAVEDRRGWRMASPHWTPQRERMVAGALEKARTSKPTPDEPDPMGSFIAQWLNRWPHPDDVELLDPDEVVAMPDQWQACLDADAEPDRGQLLVCVVEDDLGTGAAAAAAQLMADGRVVLGGHTFPTLREAVDWCDDTAETGLEAGACADAVLLAGASIAGDPELDGGTDLPVEPVGVTEFRASLSTLRDMARRGRLAHDGSEDVSRAVLDARVPRNVTGGAMLVRNGSALLRCVAWAVHRAHRDRF